MFWVTIIVLLSTAKVFLARSFVTFLVGNLQEAVKCHRYDMMYTADECR